MAVVPQRGAQRGRAARGGAPQDGADQRLDRRQPREPQPVDRREGTLRRLALRGAWSRGRAAPGGPSGSLRCPGPGPRVFPAPATRHPRRAAPSGRRRRRAPGRRRGHRAAARGADPRAGSRPVSRSPEAPAGRPATVRRGGIARCAGSGNDALHLSALVRARRVEAGPGSRPGVIPSRLRRPVPSRCCATARRGRRAPGTRWGGPG